MSNIKKKYFKCLFLDRDGVINEDSGYISDPKKIKLIKGIKELITKANKKPDWKVIIVTNQSGIGRGIYSEEDFHNFMKTLFEVLEPCVIHDYFFAPYYENSTNPEYLKNLYLRKPLPGMFFNAAKKYNLDLENSIIVGDKASDLKAGLAAGLKKGYILCDERIEFPEEKGFKRIKALSEIII